MGRGVFALIARVTGQRVASGDLAGYAPTRLSDGEPNGRDEEIQGTEGRIRRDIGDADGSGLQSLLDKESTHKRRLSPSKNHRPLGADLPTARAGHELEETSYYCPDSEHSHHGMKILRQGTGNADRRERANDHIERLTTRILPGKSRRTNSGSAQRFAAATTSSSADRDRPAPWWHAGLRRIQPPRCC